MTLFKKILLTWLAVLLLIIGGKGLSSAKDTSISGTIFHKRGILTVKGDDLIQVALFAHEFPHTPLMQVPINPEDGSYVLSDFPAGLYDVRVEAENFIDVFWTSEGSVYYRHLSEPVAVEEGQHLTGIDFQVSAGTSLSGTGYASDGVTPLTEFIDDREVGVLVYSNGGMWDFRSGLKEDGTYLVHLPPGTCFVQMVSDAYIPEWWADPVSVRDRERAREIFIDEGLPARGINFQLDKGVMVSGTIFRGDGITPVKGDMTISVSLFKDDPCAHQSQDFGGTVNEDGTFSYLVEPGSYYVKVNASNYVDEWWTPSASTWSCADAQMVKTGENEPFTSIDFQIDPGNVISGTVYDSDGTTPLINKDDLGIYVSPRDPCSKDFDTFEDYFSFVDPSSGTYFVHVPDGTYYIMLNSGRFDTIQFWADPVSVSALNCKLAQSLSVSRDREYPDINFYMIKKEISDRITILTPENNQTVCHDHTTGQMKFSFSKISDAVLYGLQFKLYHILDRTSIAFQMDLIPPLTGSGTIPLERSDSVTPGFIEDSGCMIYEFYFDRLTCNLLAQYDFKWGVEAYDNNGQIIGSTYRESTPCRHVNVLNFVADNSVVLTYPKPGAVFKQGGAVPGFQWQASTGCKTYTVLMVHSDILNIGFDGMILKERLLLNRVSVDEAKWETMPAGRWFWTVFGYDGLGRPMHEGMTFLDFHITP
ncbi:MAG: hypothetical protein U9P10_13760 [Thermodesulfobacteriota bacterium]|nr:hypothetical protein [Thermodesulfobacteriota bacterium]